MKYLVIRAFSGIAIPLDQVPTNLVGVSRDLNASGEYYWHLSDEEITANLVDEKDIHSAKKEPK